MIARSMRYPSRFVQRGGLLLVYIILLIWILNVHIVNGVIDFVWNIIKHYCYDVGQNLLSVKDFVLSAIN